MKISYGRRSNEYLLLNYGFALRDNKYQSVRLRYRNPISSEELLAKDFAKFIINEYSESAAPIVAPSAVRSVKLKRNSFPSSTLSLANPTVELLQVLRDTMIPTYKGAKDLLRYAPVDPAFEQQVVALALEIITDFSAGIGACERESQTLAEQTAPARAVIAVLPCASEMGRQHTGWRTRRSWRPTRGRSGCCSMC